jgi:hypothetical protein
VKVGYALIAGFCALVVDLIMGLPIYGLVRTIHGGTYNYSDDHNPAVLGWVLLWGLPGVALLALLMWLLLRWSDR